MLSSRYTHKIISYGKDAGQRDAVDGDIFARLGATIEYYDKVGKNITSMAFLPYT